MVKYAAGHEGPRPRNKNKDRTYKTEELEDLYEFRVGESNERAIFEEKPLPEERIVREVRIKRQAMPKLEEAKIQPLRLIGTEVIGSLFDRVNFLKQRIDEISESLKLREVIHKRMLAEIVEDIKEKESFALRVTDIDEKRNFKLDVSILRKEMRHENVQYWRDVVELRSELREFLEKYESEKKIVGIFNDIQNASDTLNASDTQNATDIQKEEA